MAADKTTDKVAYVTYENSVYRYSNGQWWGYQKGRPSGTYYPGNNLLVPTCIKLDLFKAAIEQGVDPDIFRVTKPEAKQVEVSSNKAKAPKKRASKPGKKSGKKNLISIFG